VFRNKSPKETLEMARNTRKSRLKAKLSIGDQIKIREREDDWEQEGTGRRRRYLR
jgi:hypothetical protein